MNPGIAFVAAPICDVVNGQLVPTLQDSYNECPQLGVATLVSLLKRDGIPCDLIDWVAARNFDVRTIARQVAEYKGVFASVNAMNWSSVRALMLEAKSLNPELICCVGGPHVTLYPEFVARAVWVDQIFTGECDLFISRIARRILGDNEPLDGDIIDHYWDRKSADTMNAPHKLIARQENLRKLPLAKVDYSLYDVTKYCVLPVETSRGCKFRCEFCSIPSKSYWRDYSQEIAISYLEHALPYALETRSKILSIIDDTFTTSAERVVGIAKGLSPKFNGLLNFDATIVDIRKEEVVEAMQAFASGILIGAEVSSKPDAKIIRKAATPELIVDSARVLSKYGLAQKGIYSFIIGFPWQGEAECLETLRFASRLILEYDVSVYLQWYWPIPGSGIWRALEDEGRVELSIVDTPSFFRGFKWFYSTRNLTPDDVKKVDDRILLAQSLINTTRKGLERKLNYTSPFVYAGTLEHRRNPVLAS